MAYSILSVGGDGQVALLEIEDEAISLFFKEEGNVFSEKISGLNPEAVKKINSIVGDSVSLRSAHIFTVIALAGFWKRRDVLAFIKHLQKEYSCQYIVGK